MREQANGPRAGRWARTKAVAAAVSLLLIGGVGGVALDRHLLPGAPPVGVAGLHDAALASLGDRLDLDPAQRRQVDSIVGAHHEALRETWGALHTHLGATVDTVHEALEAVLTPEQRREFRAWLAEMSDPGHH